MIVVYWTPSEADPDSGRITSWTEGPDGGFVPGARRWIEVFERRSDWDGCYEVIDQAVVPRDLGIVEAEALAFARVRLRMRRDAILRGQVDPVVTNPLRWNDLTAAQQAAWVAFRTALLDWPETEPDPLNPTEPTAPE